MADKIQCPNCKATIYDNLRFCPNCGEKIYIQSFRNDNLGDLYKILQVDPSAEQEVVEAAYKRLAAKYHPDVNKSPDALTKMQEINKAYGILSKPEIRRQYDQTRAPQSDKTELHKQGQPEKKVPEQKTQTQTNATQSRSARPKPKEYQPLKALALIIVILIGVVWCVSLLSVPASTPQPTAIPTRTLRPSPRPTEIPTRVQNRTPIRSGGNCTHWNGITYSQVGKRICGYGLVVDVYSAAEYIQIISFSEIEEGTLIIKGKDYYFEDVHSGDCVVFEGRLYENSYSLYLDIDDNDTKLGPIEQGDSLYSFCMGSR